MVKNAESRFLCLQESRAQTVQLENRTFWPDGYHCFYRKTEKKGYSGVAIYSRTRPDRVVDQFDWPLVDSEGRLIEIQIANLSILSLYALSGTSSSERQTLKFEFPERFAALLSQFRNSGRDYIVCGDWNIAHRRIDLKNWRSNQIHSGFLPEERAWMGHLFREADWIGLSSHQPAT